MSILRKLLLTSVLLVLTTAGFAADTGSVPMTATVATSLTITMTSTSVDFGSTLNPGSTSTQQVQFNFAGNVAADIYAYVAGSNALTGAVTSANIPAAALGWGALADGTDQSAFASINSTVAGAYGAKVVAAQAASDSADLAFYVTLTVPSAASAPPDDYTGTLYVKAVPAS